MASQNNQIIEDDKPQLPSEIEENSMNAGRLSKLRIYKIYTSTFKTQQQTAYHLGTFNQIIKKPSELPLTLKTAKNKQTIRNKQRGDSYIFEEEPQVGSTISEKTMFQGTEAGKFAGKFNPELKDEPESNTFGQANYAVMIYDKKRDAFRIAPIQRQINFEKRTNITQTIAKPTVVEAEKPQIQRPKTLNKAADKMLTFFRGGKKAKTAKQQLIEDNVKDPRDHKDAFKVAPEIKDDHENHEFDKHLEGYNDDQENAVEEKSYNDADEDESKSDEQNSEEEEQYRQKQDQQTQPQQILNQRGQENGQNLLKQQQMDQKNRVQQYDDDSDDDDDDDDDDNVANDDDDDYDDSYEYSYRNQQVGSKRNADYSDDDDSQDRKRHKQY